MNAKRVIAGIVYLSVCLVVAGTCAWALGQQAPGQQAPGQQALPEKPNQLVAGKYIYVAPMSDGLDQWIIDFLRRWGKYTVTSNPEGVDLVIQTTDPQKDLRLETLGGTAEPRGAQRPPFPIPRHKHDELPATSVWVVNWVTNQTVWQADILNRNPKKDETTPPAGPQAKIFARSMTSDQLAQKIVALLRRYEEGLETPAAEKK
jgi:hypothetical protein